MFDAAFSNSAYKRALRRNTIKMNAKMELTNSYI